MDQNPETEKPNKWKRRRKSRRIAPIINSASNPVSNSMTNHTEDRYQRQSPTQRRTRRRHRPGTPAVIDPHVMSRHLDRPLFNKRLKGAMTRKERMFMREVRSIPSPVITPRLPKVVGKDILEIVITFERGSSYHNDLSSSLDSDDNNEEYRFIERRSLLDLFAPSDFDEDGYLINLKHSALSHYINTDFKNRTLISVRVVETKTRIQQLLEEVLT
jgi:hypothetical protein